MYNIYLWKIKPLSSYMTPWQSDTIYGHLLYGAGLLYDESFVTSLIKEFEEYPPFIVSDGFVGNKLPMINKGNLKRNETEEFCKTYKKDAIEIIKELKEINKIKFISLDEFNKFRTENYNKKSFVHDKLLETLKEKNNKNQQSTPVMHNVINRISGSTQDNSLFHLKETYINEDIYIYIKVREDFDLEILKKLLSFMENNGFGKKTSSGKGNFKTVSFERFDGFTTIENPNAFVTLSNYIPKEFDYEEVISSSHIIKRGKVYGDTAFPFKKPFACFTQGSLFKMSENKKYGKVLKGIHIDEKIVQIGIPFTLEVKV